MQNYLDLFRQNRAWAERIRETDPSYFERRAASQEPHFFMIGCCDSRVPTEVLTGAKPGEIFTHRNIANQADPTDMNMLSALEYGLGGGEAKLGAAVADVDEQSMTLMHGSYGDVAHLHCNLPNKELMRDDR